MRWYPILFNIDAWQEVIHSVRKQFLRSLITGFNVAFGIFIFVILIGFGTGFQNGVGERFNSATNAIYIRGGVTSMDYRGLKKGRPIRFTSKDYFNLPKKVDHIGVSTRVNRLRGSKNVSYNDKTSAFFIRSVDEGYKEIDKFEFDAGRFINARDIAEKRKVVVIGEKVKRILFGPKDALGKYVNVDGIPFKVIGVFEIEDGRWQNKLIYMPISTQQIVFFDGDRVGEIVVTVADTKTETSTYMEKKITNMFSEKYQFNPKDKQAINIFNMQKEYTKWMTVFVGIKIMLGVVGIMTLIAGVVGVSNIMLITAKERKREIGLRKALGASRRSIISLFLLESSFITITSGYIGLILGVAFLRYGLFAKFMEIIEFPENFMGTADIGNITAVVATCILIISGILSGYFPARQAAKIRPIEALKDE